ncbi:hypothetical protein CBR_g39413 [Chara braunii]|uniref:CCHC-type domain-containing protein n=1 Tax=Chara braunii TaxID=69332 RepID=A0A388LRJ4_CHABU|nr:hypothetical protein CBR_g39413 [Chara braunii]|eukprot:GBG84950.1 hypothetical protein CBR_g39413 [Chara braunii]
MSGTVPGISPAVNPPAAVSCYLCGKVGHYARNCWAAGNGKPPPQIQQGQTSGTADEEMNEMKMYFRKKIQREKMEEERSDLEREEQRRKQEEMRREAKRLREVDAREARLEARLVKLVSQHTKSERNVTAPVMKKKSPRTKARVLREICNYIDESEDESDEVKHEAARLVDAIERRKGKRRNGEEKAISTTRVRTTKTTPIIIEDVPEEAHTPPTREKENVEGVYGGVLEFVLEMHKTLSAKKVPELRRICNEEGIEWKRKDVAVSEIVRCRAKLAFGEANDSTYVSPLSRR